MVKRELYMEKLRHLRNKDIIKVITGVRRCGKSYLLQLIIDELIETGVNKENIVLINFDSGEYNNIESSLELDELVLNLVKPLSGCVYLFFDEIQNVKGWERSIVSYYVDLDCDIYVTGSNSKLLSGELATHLTGRYMQIKMYPFSFNEFMDYKMETIDLNDERLLPVYEQDWLDEFIYWGAFPFSLALGEEYKMSYLQDVFNSIIYRDLIERYNIRDVALLKRLINFLLDNVGNVFSANSISKFLKNEGVSVSHITIQNYLNFLEESHMFLKVPREEIHGKELLRVNAKYYVVDTGFIRVLMGISSINGNIGHIIENIVYLELIKRGYDVTIGKVNGSEVDFVCRNYNETFYIQVCDEIHESDIEREFGPLLKIKDAYPKYIVSRDKSDKSFDGIKHINLLKFLKDFVN